MSIHPLIVILLCCSLIGAFFLVGAFAAFKKGKVLRPLRSLVFALLFILCAACSGLLFVANHGYRMLTKEEVAATITVTPLEAQRFAARVELRDSTVTSYLLTGDQLYIDAHILKWHPWLNVLGVHTSYELDRIGGRYRSSEDEKAKPRTLYSLSKNRTLNMFDLRRKFAALTPLLDAEYGSATFIESHRAATFQVLVSTSGLLIRDLRIPASRLQKEPL